MIVIPYTIYSGTDRTLLVVKTAVEMLSGKDASSYYTIDGFDS